MNNFLPSIKVLQEEMHSLKRERSLEKVEGRLRSILGYYDVLNYDRKLNRPVFRVQKCSEQGFENIARLMHPPREYARIGRLNEKGESRLYAALDVQTCLAELGAQEGDFFHLIGLRPRTRSIRCAAVGQFAAAHKDGPTVSTEVRDALARVSRNSPRDATLAFLFLDAMLASLINDVEAKKFNYVYSRVLARLILEKHDYIEAIEYPSVRRPFATNLMVAKAAADDMEIVGTSVLKVVGVYDFGFYDFRLTRDGDSWLDGGLIRWRSGAPP